MSEFECNRSLSASMAPVEGKGWNVTQMGGCGGIGTAANVYMYGKAFLRPFLSHRHVPRGMQELVQRTTDYQEPLRPDMDAVVQALEAMVQEEEAAPSAYTAPYFVPSAKGKGSKRKGHG
uniref:Uncharacterized protein n=1 Tax=Eutreptiella gymnastica TaxID=73025 RepID=A0A7S4D0P9_9EUGL